MQSLIEILGDKDFGVPTEVTEIKAYVMRHFNMDIGVIMQTSAIVITVQSASFAGSLRPHLHKLSKQLDTTKKLIIRIC